MALWDVGVMVAHLTEDQSVWVRIPYVPPAEDIGFNGF